MKDVQGNHGYLAQQVNVPSGDPDVCERCDYFMVCRIRMQQEANDPCKDGAPVRRNHVEKANRLYRAGEPFHGLYVVTDGAFKSIVAADDGGEEVVGFHFPGEYVGLEAFGNGFYSSTLHALEPSGYCSLDVAGVQRIGAQLVDLQTEIIRNLCLDTRHFQWRCQHLLRASVDQRLAGTLLDFARRLGKGSGRPVSQFRLPMSRRDIANYLGMAPETLYRAFRRLAEDGLIGLEGRTLRIISIPSLERFSYQNSAVRQQEQFDPLLPYEATKVVAVDTKAG